MQARKTSNLPETIAQSENLEHEQEEAKVETQEEGVVKADQPVNDGLAKNGLPEPEGIERDVREFRIVKRDDKIPEGWGIGRMETVEKFKDELKKAATEWAIVGCWGGKFAGRGYGYAIEYTAPDYPKSYMDVCGDILIVKYSDWLENSKENDKYLKFSTK